MKAERVQLQLKRTPGWQLVDGAEAITRSFEFPTFRAAVAYANYVAELAEAADHHPDILISYKIVTLTLTTQSAAGLTGEDFDLARAVTNCS